jgi:predicted kinase
MSNNKPLLVMFVGIPGSGKTTFARQLAKELPAVILNSDSMRLGMWKTLDDIQRTHKNTEERRHANQLTFGAMNYATKQILAAGDNVLYDCNANHKWERQEKHDIASEIGAMSVVIRISVPSELSLRRVQEREVTHDQRRMSLERAVEVLERFTNEIEEPTPHERVITIDGAMPFKEQLRLFRQQLVRVTGYDD